MKRNKMRRMTMAQLDELLQAELRKDSPNEEVVLPILEILEQREQKPHRKNRWIISVAAATAAFAMLITIVPKMVGANSLWDAMLYVTDSILQFFTPGDTTPKPTEAEYAFETDNPGLQQLYDKVVELGITDPVVPMWLPDGFELDKSDILNLGGNIKISSSFKMGDNEILIMYKITGEISSTQYERLQEQVEVYERGRVGHTIIKNADNWTVTWVRDNVEGLIAVDANKEDIYRIIQSIYRRN